MTKIILKKFYKTLPLSLFFCATIFIFAPFDVYLKNILEFNYSFQALCFTIIPKALLAWFCVSIFLTMTPEKFNINKRIFSILFMATLLFIIQGIFLTQGYGVLDGATAIETFSARAVVNILIWSLGLILGLIFYNFIYNHIVKFCAILIIAQTIPLAMSIYNNNEIEDSTEDLWYRKYKVDESNNLFSYSKDENIIFIVADSFSYKTLEKILSEKEYREMFAGFNSFSDVASNFPTTIVSITAMLTGQIYDNSIPRPEFTKNSFLSEESLPMFFKNKGYLLKVDHMSGVTYTAPELFDNVIERGRQRINASSLINATLFKYVPHYFKQSFINVNAPKNMSDQRKWLDSGFFNKINKSKFDSDSIAPVFSFFHLTGSHLPFVVDDNFNISDTATEVSQSKATLKLIATFMNRLKDIGVYDNSTIVVVSDHTSGSPLELFHSHAILMIKRKNAEKMSPIKEIVTPISLSDVSGLIKWILNNKEKDIEKFDAEIPRRYYGYTWLNDWVSGYIPDMTEYLIPEHVSKQDLYIKTGKVFKQKKVNSFPVGKEVSLTEDYESIKETFAGSWKKVHSGMVFLGDSGIFVGSDESSMLSIRVTFLEYGEEKNDISHIAISTQNRNKIVPMPEGKIIKSILVSVLGPYIPISYGETFTGDSKFKQLYAFGDGWSGSEGSHIWSINQKSTLPLLLERTPRSDLKMTIVASAFLGKQLQQQSMDILINDSVVKSVKFNSEKNGQDINFTIPKSLIKDNKIIITFMLDKELTSPSVEYGNGDARQLGILLSSLQVSELPYILLKNNIPLTTNDFGNIAEGMDGWHRSEDTHIWSSNKKSNLRLAVENRPANDVEIVFNIIPFLTATFDKQTLDVIIDNKIIQTINYKYGDNQDSFAIKVPQSLFVDNAVDVIFSLKHEPASPKKEGISDDDRHLGINLSLITLN